MTPVPSQPLPGSMTVPPWFGWEAILVVLVVMVVVAVAFFVATAVGTDVDRRSEWQAGLDARSHARRHAVAGPDRPGPRDRERAAEGAADRSVLRTP